MSQMGQSMQDLLTFTQLLARETGELIVGERSSVPLTRNYKGGKELVTQADLKADKLICDRLKVAFPDHAILSEESSPQLQEVWNLSELVWIIDPIDGTVNYAHGHNQSAVSIAYCESGQITLGVVYNPFTNEMFHAVAGEGAYLNNTPIEVAGETELNRAIIATGFPYVKDDIAAMVERVGRVLTHCADIRRLGSAALDICWLAAGRLDGYYESLSLWDFAAARLIALEAGATCGHFSEVPVGIDPQFHARDLLIANPVLYPKLRELLSKNEE